MSYEFEPVFDSAGRLIEVNVLGPSETKGGKPSKGTPKDGRLAENQESKKPRDEDKRPFPGAAKPFGRKK